MEGSSDSRPEFDFDGNLFLLEAGFFQWNVGETHTECTLDLLLQRQVKSYQEIVALFTESYLSVPSVTDTLCGIIKNYSKVHLQKHKSVTFEAKFPLSNHNK